MGEHQEAVVVEGRDERVGDLLGLQCGVAGQQLLQRAGVSCRTLRTVTAATTAPTNANPDATRSAVENPSTNASGERRSPTFAAMIAPISATPIEPPTWRMLFMTAEPTPALSVGTEPMIAAADGVIVSDIPTPPINRAGSRSQKVASVPSVE